MLIFSLSLSSLLSFSNEGENPSATCLIDASAAGGDARRTLYVLLAFLPPIEGANECEKGAAFPRLMK
jgi:hypothetical protein